MRAERGGGISHTPNRMKTILFTQFGSPTVLTLVERPMPACNNHQLLIKIHAAGLNPIDYKIRNGSSFVARQLKDHLPSGLGYDFSGVVETIGKEAQDIKIKIGDAVMGIIGLPDHPGSYAEYICITPECIIPKPATLSFLQAAALPTAGLTVLQALQLAKISTGQTVLIHAGAGGVGHLAIQLARQLGATVITTASQRNHDFLYALGTNRCIDYHKENFVEAINQPVDAVIDLVGGRVGIQSLEILSPTGYLVTVPTITAEEVIAAAKQKNRRAMGFLKKSNKSDLADLAQSVAEGRLKIEIDRVFQLSEAAAAHEYLESGHVRGKLVFSIKEVY